MVNKEAIQTRDTHSHVSGRGPIGRNTHLYPAKGEIHIHWVGHGVGRSARPTTR